MGVEMTVVDSFLMPNPFSTLPRNWIKQGNLYSIISLPDSRLAFVEMSIRKPFIFDRFTKRLWEIGGETGNYPDCFIGAISLFCDYPYLWVSDEGSHRLSKWRIDEEDIAFVGAFSIPDLRFIPWMIVVLGDTIVVSGRKYYMNEEGRPQTLTVQTYNANTGEFISEGSVFSPDDYDIYLSPEGMELSHFLSNRLCLFGRGFLSSMSIFPDVIYYNAKLDTLGVFDVAPPSYIAPGAYEGSLETTTFEEDIEWVGTWSHTGCPRVFNDSVAVIDYELGGKSELVFFKPGTGEVIGITAPFKGALMDIYKDGRLLVVSEEVDKEAIKMVLYEVDFDD